MSEHNNSDQWKLSGICQLCRRQSYCKTQCKAKRTLMKVYTAEMIQKVMQESKGIFPDLSNALHAAAVIPDVNADAQTIRSAPNPGETTLQ